MVPLCNYGFLNLLTRLVQKKILQLMYMDLNQFSKGLYPDFISYNLFASLHIVFPLPFLACRILQILFSLQCGSSKQASKYYELSPFRCLVFCISRGLKMGLPCPWSLPTYALNLISLYFFIFFSWSGLIHSVFSSCWFLQGVDNWKDIKRVGLPSIS
jgi:hypothetical protein